MPPNLPARTLSHTSSTPSPTRRNSYNYDDEEPLEERLGRYAREHCIIREDETLGEWPWALGEEPPPWGLMCRRCGRKPAA